MKKIIFIIAFLMPFIAYSQKFHFETKTGTDEFNLSEFDSLVIENKQIYSNDDVTVIFPVGAIPIDQEVKIYKTQDSATHELFDNIMEDYKIASWLGYTYRVEISISSINAENFFLDIKIPNNLISITPPNYRIQLFCKVIQDFGEEYIDNFVLIPCDNDSLNNSLKTVLGIYAFENLGNNDHKLEFTLASIPDESMGSIIQIKKNNFNQILNINKIGCPFKNKEYCPGGTKHKVTAQYHGYKVGNYLHDGVDFRTKDINNPSDNRRKLVAVSDGVVDYVECLRGYGNTIKINHKDRTYSRYCHLSEIYVKKGYSVERGITILGKSGGGSGDPCAGTSTGPHLHFEYWDKKMNKINPLPYIDNDISVEEKIIEDRNGNRYEIVHLNGRWWMAKNLRRGDLINTKNKKQTDNSKVEMYGYDNNYDNMEKYGGFYTWDEAMYYRYDDNQGICPDKWHIPTDEEWKELEKSLGMTNHDRLNMDSREYCRGSDEGKTLKLNGFNVQYGGAWLVDDIGNSFFAYKDKSANYWTSSTDNSGNHFIRRINSDQGGILRATYQSDIYAFCVRCIKDVEEDNSPKITYIQPIIVPNETITIKGKNLGSKDKSTLNNFSENMPIPKKQITKWDNNEIKFKVPTDYKFDGMNLFVKTKNWITTKWYSLVKKYKKPVPTINNIYPHSTYEGEEITIVGNNFGEYKDIYSTYVQFNSKIPLNNLNWTNNEIKFKIPEGASSGNVYVIIDKKRSKQYYYTVSEKPSPKPYISIIEPTRLFVGDEMKIIGWNFGKGHVYFNNKEQSNLGIGWSDNLIEIKIREGTTSGQVHVNVDGVESNKESYIILQLPDPPNISNITPTPNDLRVGDLLTIYGDRFYYNYSGNDFVSFNGVKAIPDKKQGESWINTKIKVKVPEGATTGKLFVSVKAQKSNEFDFTIEEPNPNTGTVTDQQGNVYKTVKFVDQWWMVENLKRGTFINSSTKQTDNQEVEMYGYDNNSQYCKDYGGLYTWDEAMNYSTQPGSRGICPNGWHIPTDEEFKELERNLGMPENDLNNEDLIGNFSERGKEENVGLKMKEREFNGLLVGARLSQEFDGFGSNVFYWTSTQTSGTNTWSRSLYKNTSGVARIDELKSQDFCIRCIKDK